MVKNELRVGEPRLCYVIDGNQDAPQSVVMLQNTENAITATFPISGIASLRDGPHDRWWASDFTCYMDDLDRTKYSYSPPPVLFLNDANGSVVLVGCRATGGASRSLSAGNGALVADFAVLGGGNVEYERINGMWTRSLAYVKWIGGSSFDYSWKSDKASPVRSVSLSIHLVDDRFVAQRLKLSVREDVRVKEVANGFDVRKLVSFQTLVTRARKWSEHLDVHIGMLDLVALAAWRNCAFQEVRVHREDDPKKGVGGDKIGAQWLEVVSHRFPGEDLSDCKGRFLFAYRDMPKGGISRWLRMRVKYGRAFDYLFRILRSGRTWSPQSSIMSGIALEQLAYLIEVNDNQGAQLNGRGALSFMKALDVVINDMVTLPIEREEIEGWKERCRSVYMGAKHGDRPEIDHLTRLNTHRENLLILRYWIAQKLGVSGDVLQHNLQFDPLCCEFVSR